MKLLCIGNSYSTFWPDELWGLLHGAGDEDVRVSNVYYSGCTFEMHWTWHVNGEANTHFFSARSPVREERSDDYPSTLLHALTADQWDCISLQQSNRYSTGGMRTQNELVLPKLYELVKSYHPNAKYFWPQNWAHEIKQGNTRRGEPSLEAQTARAGAFLTIAEEVREKYGFTVVPLGNAWQSIRHDPVFYEKGEGEAPVRSLHTRIQSAGKMKGEIINTDLSHDGDVGGGQYLNGCVWYEMLTGKSVIGNPFRPTYNYKGLDITLSEKKIEMLQNAAHQAVLQYYGADFYK